MKWFKHSTKARHDPKLMALQEAFGPLEALGFYYSMLEIVAAEMDETDRCSADYSAKSWGRLCGVTAARWLRLARAAAELGLFRAKNQGNSVRVEMPNLLKHRDNHTKNLQANCKKLALDKNKSKNKNKISPPTPLDRGGEERENLLEIEKDEDGFPPGGGEKGDYRRHSKKIRDYLATKFWEELESAGRTNCNDIPGQATKRLAVLFGRYTWNELLQVWERYTDANKYNVVDGKEYRLSMQKFMRDEEIRQWLDMPEKAFRRILEGHAKKNQHEGKLHYGETYAISS